MSQGKMLSSRLGVLPYIGGATLEEDNPHSGSDIGLSGCIFSYVQDVTSFLSTHLNCLAMDSCSAVAISHLTGILLPNHTSTDCSVVQILLTFMSSGKTNNVALISNF